MPLDDIFQTFDLKWGPCKPYDDIVAKVDYIEQTDAGLKIHCHKVEKEKKMNKNEELKNVDTIIITRDGNTVSLNAYDKSSGLGHPAVCHKTIAECSPDDVFDFNIGAKLAFDRLYEGYDMTPKPKRKPYNGLIYIHHYPGNYYLADSSVYRVVDGKIKGCWYHDSPESDPYIFSDMTDEQLSRKIQTDVYGSDAPSDKVIAYFVHNDKA